MMTPNLLPAHYFIYVVVVPVIETVDILVREASRPVRPFPIAYPALAECGDPDAIGLQGVRKVEVLDLDRVVTGGYAGQQVLMCADFGSCSVVVHPIECVLHGRYPFRAVLRECSSTRRGFSFTVLIVNFQVAVSLRYRDTLPQQFWYCQESCGKIFDMREIPEQYRVLGTAELAEYLGYTRSTIYSHLTRELWTKIPPPSLRLATGPIWYLGDVEEWRSSRESQRVDTTN